MTIVEQIHLVPLYSLNELNGGGQRKKVLEHIQISGYWYKTDANDQLMTTRNEYNWRNKFSYERQHLVEIRCMENNRNGIWKITDEGRTRIADLAEKLRNENSEQNKCCTPKFLQKILSGEFFPEETADRILLEQLETAESACEETLPALENTPKPKGAVTQHSGTRNIYYRDPNIAVQALRRAEYRCEIDGSHPTFIRRTTRLPYMEPHHLIPMSETDNFDVSLDREQNIICLCSTCHKQIHYGTKDSVREMITKLFDARKDQLSGILGKEITLQELLSINHV